VTTPRVLLNKHLGVYPEVPVARGQVARRTTLGNTRHDLVVILGTGGITAGKLWAFLEAAITGGAKTLIGEVRRLEYPRGFILRGVDNRPASDIVSTLDRHCHRMGWQVRAWHHRGENMSRARVPNGPTGESPRALQWLGVTPRSTMLLSWNINRWASKRAEFAYYISHKKPLFVCVQETWCTETDWRPRVKGYTVYHTAATDQKGCNGVMVMTRNCVKAVERRGVPNFLQAVRAFDVDGSSPWNVASIYRPCETVVGWRHSVRKWMEGIKTSEPTIIAGDWNWKCEALRRFLVSVGTSWHILKIRGSNATRKSNDIDHVVVNQSGLLRLCHGVVDRSIDLSDHWPLTAALRPHAQRESGKPNEAPVDGWQAPKKVCRMKVEQQAPLIAHSNRWDSLLGLSDQSDVAEAFSKAAGEICDGGEMYAEPNQGERSEYLPRDLKKQINRRRKLYVKMQKSRGEEKDRLYTEYLQARKTTRDSMKEFHREAFTKWIERGCKAVLDGASGREAWIWLKQTAGDRRDGTATAVYSNEGKSIIDDPLEVAKRWTDHFSGLAEAGDSESLNLDFWENRLKDYPKREDEWAGINGVIQWSEVQEVLRASKNNKAAGLDGIPMEFLKAMASGEIVSENPTDPVTPGGKALLHICNTVYSRGVPKEWDTAIVIPIFKKGGDKLDPGDYRGISLIPVCNKIVTKIVEQRLSRAAKMNGFLIREQAGFRAKEEAVSLYATLHQTCRGRLVQGLPTYVTFLDFKKAYDSVPIEALLVKLDKLGIRGQTLQFLRGLYYGSKSTVRVNDLLSPTFVCERGVRQGDPLSPLLFNIFINDLFDLIDWGVHLDRETLIKGALFADDAAVTSETPGDHQMALSRVFEWAKRHKMTFGIKKCGTMVVGGETQIHMGERAEMLLGDDMIPRVDTYKYLGIPFRKDLGLQDFIGQKQLQITRAVAKFSPLLSCKRIPLALRSNFFKAKILSLANYGGELLGYGHGKGREQLQRKVNDAVKIMIGGGSSMVATAALQRELGILPLQVHWEAAQIRAHEKWRDSATIASSLFMRPRTNKRKRGVQDEGRRVSLRSVDTIYQSILNQRDNTDVMIPMVRNWALDGERLKRKYNLIAEPVANKKAKIAEKVLGLKKNLKGVAIRRYIEFGYHGSREYIKLAQAYPRLSLGIDYLTRLRTGGLFDTNAAFHMDLLPEGEREKCVLCAAENIKYDMEHIILRCSYLSELRVKTKLDERLRSMPEGPSSNDRWTLGSLLGRTTGGQVDQQWLTVTHSETGSLERGSPPEPRTARQPGFVIIAAFLTEACRMYQRGLWRKIGEVGSTMQFPKCRRAFAYGGPGRRHPPS
jgi:exonuclease III